MLCIVSSFALFSCFRVIIVFCGCYCLSLSLRYLWFVCVFLACVVGCVLRLLSFVLLVLLVVVCSFCLVSVCDVSCLLCVVCCLLFMVDGWYLLCCVWGVRGCFVCGVCVSFALFPFWCVCVVCCVWSIGCCLVSPLRV